MNFQTKTGWAGCQKRRLRIFPARGGSPCGHPDPWNESFWEDPEDDDAAGGDLIETVTGWNRMA